MPNRKLSRGAIRPDGATGSGSTLSASVLGLCSVVAEAHPAARREPRNHGQALPFFRHPSLDAVGSTCRTTAAGLDGPGRRRSGACDCFIRAQTCSAHPLSSKTLNDSFQATRSAAPRSALGRKLHFVVCKRSRSARSGHHPTATSKKLLPKMRSHSSRDDRHRTPTATTMTRLAMPNKACKKPYRADGACNPAMLTAENDTNESACACGGAK
jgi:hypothetical protein